MRMVVRTRHMCVLRVCGSAECVWQCRSDVYSSKPATHARVSLSPSTMPLPPSLPGAHPRAHTHTHAARRNDPQRHSSVENEPFHS